MARAAVGFTKDYGPPAAIAVTPLTQSVLQQVFVVVHRPLAVLVQPSPRGCHPLDKKTVLLAVAIIEKTRPIN